ncbi:MAG TPA: nodulation protein NfeD [Steroidobacter sp.]|uniref:NfeD family protein n=1 Tax=Steroidobacter sp. TaxID=1978227 RepID=UPI002EDB46C8
MALRQNLGSSPMKAALLACLLFMSAACTSAAWAAQEKAAREGQPEAPSNLLVRLEIRDAIGPATSGFLLRGLERARERNAQLVVIEMDTPGGLDTAMREMIQAILASPVPVAIYVAPSGARAASAGTYLLYASHIAAMAPATSIGAATPVQIGGGGSSPPDAKDKPAKDKPADDKQKDGKQEEGKQEDENVAPGTATERKAINDAVSFIRGLAELRGRNADWAEEAVRKAVSLTASAALEQKIIDVVAADLPDLLRQIDGREVRTQFGTVQLKTEGLVIEDFEADWRVKLLSVLTNPNVAYLLMLAGIYGLLLEGYNPGAVLPGVVGAVSLLLALYAFQILDVNYAGLALIALGIALIVGEAFSPSVGVLGIGGIVSFVIGSILLFDTGVPGFQIARGLIGGAAFGAAIIMLLTVTLFMRARKAPVTSGVEQMLHETAVAMEDFDTTGHVTIRGEIWQAVARAPVKKGQRLQVVRVDGLTLEVVPRE